MEEIWTTLSYPHMKDIRKQEMITARHFVKYIVGKTKDMSKLFHNFIRKKSCVKESLIRLRDSKERRIDDYEGLNENFSKCFHSGEFYCPNISKVE